LEFFLPTSILADFFTFHVFLLISFDSFLIFLASYINTFFYFLKAFLLAYISCIGRIHCDISKYDYIVHWLDSLQLSLSPSFSSLHLKQLKRFCCSISCKCTNNMSGTGVSHL
jgi:hypothetical protein